MLICGLKLTHDGAVALIEDGKLIFSVETEKLNNNARYTGIEDTSLVEQVLEDHGYRLDAIDHIAVDGWGGFNQDALAIQPRLEIGDLHNRLSVAARGAAHQISIAQYQERSLRHNVLEEWKFDGFPLGGRSLPYSSYLHVTGHILSAYCTSPFAGRHESAFVLVWDGGMYPRLYFFDPEQQSVENLGPIFLLIGNVYSIFAQHFGPFKVEGTFAKDSLSVAGKVMAYIAKGTVRRELFAHFEDIYQTQYDHPMGFANLFANEFRKRTAGASYDDADVLHSFHAYLEELLLAKLKKKVERHARTSGNLCLAGGCALNIKWNSAIRNSGLFDQVYVPPFPNDSGSAIGAACAAMLRKSRRSFLDWDVYSGPAIIENQPAAGWTQSACPVPVLAALLHRQNEPVVFLHGRAELGPRALGNRSIIAPATAPGMKGLLNLVKKRENYRPVSPICLEEPATAIFDPGTSDPFMLFDHTVRPGWLERIPAVCHLDETARLQTVTLRSNPLVAGLLAEYEKLSGIPLLCNTSANHNGSGFFPCVHSATQWNQVNYVWCNGVLYERTEKIAFPDVRVAMPE